MNEEIKELSDYLHGYADAVGNDKIQAAALWLERTADATCRAGVIGCDGGQGCTSDHK